MPAPRASSGRARRWLRLGAVAVASFLLTILVSSVVVLPPMMAGTLLHPPRHVAAVTPAILGLAYQDVTIPAQNLALQGWYLPGNGPNAVVLVHGAPGNRGQMLPLAPALHAAGYHLLLYDQRAQGASEGEAVTYGYYEAGDLVAVAGYLRARSGAERVGALGISLGGAVVLLGAGQGAPVDAVVADSSFADLAGLIEEGTPMRMFFLGQVLVGNAVGALWERLSPLVVWYAERESGLRAAAVRPLDAVEAIGPRPLLLVHGTADRLFSHEHTLRLYERAAEPKELWLVPDAGHGRTRAAAPAEYDRRVVDFFDRAFTR